MHDPEKRILTKATAKVQGRKGKQTREANVEAENLVNKEWSSYKLIDYCLLDFQTKINFEGILWW